MFSIVALEMIQPIHDIVAYSYKLIERQRLCFLALI